MPREPTPSLHPRLVRIYSEVDNRQMPNTLNSGGNDSRWLRKRSEGHSHRTLQNWNAGDCMLASRSLEFSQKNSPRGGPLCPTTSLSATTARRSSPRSYSWLITKGVMSAVPTAAARMWSNAGPRSVRSRRRRAPDDPGVVRVEVGIWRSDLTSRSDVQRSSFGPLLVARSVGEDRR